MAIRREALSVLPFQIGEFSGGLRRRFAEPIAGPESPIWSELDGELTAATWSAQTFCGYNMTTPADRLLNHFDRLAGAAPKFTCVTDEGVEPRFHVATYFGFPYDTALTGFTMGLSHFHPPDGTHKELMISMLDSNDAWALACGFIAFQLRERCPFDCGETVNFKDQITPSSRMSAFVAVHPLHLSSDDRIVDIGIRNVELMQLVPLYDQERSWILAGGDLDLFLNEYGPLEIMNPNRREFAP